MKENSERCGAQALVGSVLCFSHDPRARKEKAAAVQRGGRSPKKSVRQLETMPLKTPGDAAALLEDAIGRVRTEPFDVRKANSVGYLVNVALKVFEVADFEERLKRLEGHVVR